MKQAEDAKTKELQEAHEHENTKTDDIHGSYKKDLKILHKNEKSPVLAKNNKAPNNTEYHELKELSSPLPKDNQQQNAVVNAPNDPTQKSNIVALDVEANLPEKVIDVIDANTKQIASIKYEWMHPTTGKNPANKNCAVAENKPRVASAKA